MTDKDKNPEIERELQADASRRLVGLGEYLDNFWLPQWKDEKTRKDYSALVDSLPKDPVNLSYADVTNLIEVFRGFALAHGVSPDEVSDERLKQYFASDIVNPARDT